MNDTDFKRHLKDLAHGHHHPEEHDWDRTAAKKAAAPKAAAKPRAKKTTKRK